MFIGCACVLAASALISEAPDLMRDRLASTNETAGVFVQTKRLPDGAEFVSRGTYTIRPGVDFSWRTTDPFDSLFLATQTKYCYSNEDECVTRPLSELRGYSRFAAAGKGDFSAFFKSFDALYKEDPEGVFHILARPNDPRLAGFLERVDADGTVTNWTLKATFPDGTTFTVSVMDVPRR